MKSVIASISLAVLSGLAQAVQFTNSAYDVVAGQPITLTWSDGTGPYQLLLKDGPSTDLDTVSTLVASTTDESAVVTLPSTLTTGTYAFQIVDTGDSSSNYSPQFAFAGAAPSSTVTSASSTTTIVSTTAASTTTITSASSSSSSSAATTSDSSASTTASTTGSSSSTLATTTTSSTSTRTSSAAATSSTIVSTNNAAGVSAPFAALVLAGAIAAAF